MTPITRAPEVFSLGEVGRAAGARTAAVRALAESGAIGLLPSGFLTEAEALRAIRLLRDPASARVGPPLFAGVTPDAQRRAIPLLASGAAHATVLLALAFVTTLGISAPSITSPLEFKPVRLVFLASPGPGGGGGGGGLKQPAPAAQARLKGTSGLRSPVPPRAVKSDKPRNTAPRPASPPQPRAVENPTPPPPPLPRPDPSPPVAAPVVPVPADPADRSGVLSESAPENGSRGSGDGGGSGTGSGSGVGEGSGPGVGPGTGGGTGGGPYRPGAGITPPELVREIRPNYTDEARRRNIEGEVVLEIVVRRDGTVGGMKVLQGLGGGLDARAIEAVRQWRFSPARRHGTPVDVLVEVAVEFRLR